MPSLGEEDVSVDPAAHNKSWTDAAAHMPSPRRSAVNAAVSQQAAMAANAYRGELSAARAAAAQRLNGHQQQMQPASVDEDPSKKHMASPSRMAPQYQYASRNPITGGPGAGVAGLSRPGTAGGSRPGTAGGEIPSPRSQSKLAALC